MIHMPHRSVTRFFIPLIDVLLLLFVIFLLMPIGEESKLESYMDKTSDLTGEGETVRSELERRTEELKDFEDDRPKLQEFKKLREELERLKEANRKNLQQ